MCGDSIVYDPGKAGSTVQCSYCKQALRIPLPNELDPDSYKQHMQELERERKRKVQQQQKAEARRKQEEEAKRQAAMQEAEERRQTEREQREMERYHEDKRAQEHNLREMNAEIHAVTAATPEESVPGNEYPAIDALFSIYRVVAVLCAIGAGIALVFGIGLTIDRYSQDLPGSLTPLVVGGGIAVAMLFQSLFLWATSELLQIVVQQAQDLRIIRYLLKRLPPSNKSAGETQQPSSGNVAMRATAKPIDRDTARWLDGGELPGQR